MSQFALQDIYDKYGYDAKLPASYERAVNALSECNSIDEVKEWRDKAEAIRSYAKQVDDERLEKYAHRIKARAYRRMGELLKQFDGRGGDHGNQYTGGKSDITDTFATQYQIQHDAGISNKVATTSKRLANIPEGQFNEQIESENPPTITKLAEQGINRNAPQYQPKPDGWNDMIHMMNDFRKLVEKMDQFDPLYIMNAMDERDVSQMKAYINQIEAWCDTFIINIE